MSRQTFLLLAMGVLLIFLTALEKAVGLPLLTLTILCERFSFSNFSSKAAWILGFGSILAVIYQLPFSVGMILVFLLAIGSSYHAKVARHENLKVMGLVLIASVVIGLTTGLRFTSWEWLAHSLYFGVIGVASYFWLHRRHFDPNVHISKRLLR